MTSQIPTYDEVLNSNGMQYFSRMEASSVSHHCFDMNMQELVQTLERYSAAATEMIILEQRKAIQRLALRETARHLHNCVASAKSLVEHTRILMTKHYSRTPKIYDAYKKKVKETFSENGNAAMIEDLRNHFLHVGVPPFYMKFSFSFTPTENGKISASSGIFLGLNDLKSRCTLKAQSKRYLASFTADISLLDLVLEYRNTVEEFHLWFSQCLNDHHANDIRETNEMHSAMESFLPWPSPNMNESGS